MLQYLYVAGKYVYRFRIFVARSLATSPNTLLGEVSPLISSDKVDLSLQDQVILFSDVGTIWSFAHILTACIRKSAQHAGDVGTMIVSYFPEMFTVGGMSTIPEVLGRIPKWCLGFSEPMDLSRGSIRGFQECSTQYVKRDPPAGGNGAAPVFQEIAGGG